MPGWGKKQARLEAPRGADGKMCAMRRAMQVGLILVAAVAAIAPIPAPIVEATFSTRVYPAIQHTITPLANLVPFAWFDVIVVAVIAGVVWLLVRAWRDARRVRRWAPALHRLWGLAVAAAALYVVFLLLWGLNYRRVPMTARLLLDRTAPTREAVNALGRQAAMQMNMLYARAHALGWAGDEWHDASLIRSFTDVQQMLEDTPAVVPGRLKWTIFGPYFRWTGVDGMVDPYALEVLANPDLLPWERPFVAAHEWSHLAGFADESEANFVGWLACVRGDAAAQYSGWLYLFWEVSGEVSGRDRGAMLASLDAGPRSDVTAIAERLRRGQLPLLRTVSWAMYDQYLRANRVDEGIRSYGEVVTLILRARFEEGFRPVRRH
ncbi:MAG TPA: DUF3810 family protein [Vicinamibacterales bacterium]|nr:DUF3810 family protein [Vicinamibacterales bacterium]